MNADAHLRLSLTMLYCRSSRKSLMITAGKFTARAHGRTRDAQQAVAALELAPRLRGCVRARRRRTPGRRSCWRTEGWSAPPPPPPAQQHQPLVPLGRSIKPCSIHTRPCRPTCSWRAAAGGHTPSPPTCIRLPAEEAGLTLTRHGECTVCSDPLCGLHATPAQDPRMPTPARG